MPRAKAIPSSDLFERWLREPIKVDHRESFAKLERDAVQLVRDLERIVRKIQKRNRAKAVRKPKTPQRRS